MYCNEMLVSQQWTLLGQTASYLRTLGVLDERNPHPWCLLSFFLLCFWSLCLGGVRRHGGWVDELMSLHVAVLASTPVSRLHGYEHAGEPVRCHFPGAIHPVF